MNMRDNFPIMFNSTVIPFPSSWTEKYDVIEEVNQSESGVDLIQTIRAQKLTVSASFTVRAGTALTLRSFKNLASFSLKIYDTLTGAYATYTVRMRNFSQKLKRKSQDLDGELGVWEISFDLIEI